MNEKQKRAQKLIIARQERNVAYLIKSLEETDSDLRCLAVKYLLKLHAVESIPTLIRLLRSSDRDVRIAAISALDEFRATDAIEDLKILAYQDRIGIVRTWALYALAEIDGDVGFETAREAWNDDHWQVRCEVVEIFTKHGGSDEYALIVDALKHEKSWYRRVYYLEMKRRLKKRIRREGKSRSRAVQ